MRYAIAVLMLGVLTPRSWSQPPPEEINQVAGRSFDEWMKDVGHKDPSKREIATSAALRPGYRASSCPRMPAANEPGTLPRLMPTTPHQKRPPALFARADGSAA